MNFFPTRRCTLTKDVTANERYGILSNFPPSSNLHAMKKTLRSLLLPSALFATFFLGSWTGGPAPESKSDSLAIIRVVQPINEKFDIAPALFVSKGLGRISQVEMNDIPAANSDLAVEKAISGFINNGYTLQNSTELMHDGMLLNTFYLRKKVS